MSSSRTTSKSFALMPDFITSLIAMSNPSISRLSRALVSASGSAPRSSMAATAMSPLIPDSHSK